MPLSNNQPFLLKPAGKDSLWGGRRLKDDFGKDFLDMDPLAETWECSTHPNGPSIVSSGQYKGMLLSDVLKLHPEYLGLHPKCEPGQIPVLIKFIDAKKDLSVQVHPSDAYAKVHEHGSLGKTEMWYVLDAEPGASLVYGFRRDVDEKTVRQALKDNTILKYLNKVEIHKNDVFYVHSGTVHAICAGALIAEIQESSDLTYRLYDYNRLGKDGKPRELHIEKALQVMNYHGMDNPKQPMRVLRYKPGRATELLVRCKYFETSRMLINTERVREMADFCTDSNTFQVLLCYEGCGTIFNPKTEKFLNFFKGDCIFVPANSDDLKIHGKAEFLRVRC